jgi:ABC-type lipopolysaccharide export system ATPase subunit
MKKIKLALTSLTLVLAITGVVVAKANEKKRALTTIAYVQRTAGTFMQLTAQDNVFDAQGSSTAAKIVDKFGNQIPIYISQSTSAPALFQKP